MQGDGVLAASTTKKVLIDRFDRSTVRGFVNPQAMSGAGGVELLSLDGQASTIPLEQIKALSFSVRFRLLNVLPVRLRRRAHRRLEIFFDLKSV